MKKIVFAFLFLTFLLKTYKFEEVDCTENNNINKKKLYFDMDGNIDDIVCLLLLLYFPNIDLVGVAITPGDCDIPPAKEAVSKILHRKEMKIPIINIINEHAILGYKTVETNNEALMQIIKNQHN